MLTPQYYTIDEGLEFIDEPNRTACRRFIAENLELLRTVQGSTHNHQAWPGGYLDHVQEGMNCIIVDYAVWNTIRQLPFTLSSALLSFFCHDAEKPWKYESGPDGALRHRPGMKTKESHHRLRMEKLAECGITLTPEEENAVRYAEGELNDYSSRERKMSPLAAFVHRADVMSARIFFNHPLEMSDPWSGAKRVRS